MQSVKTQIQYSNFHFDSDLYVEAFPVTQNNLNNSVAALLDKYSLEDILFTLYCKVDDLLKKNPQKSANLQQQLNVLDTACSLLEDTQQEDDFYLIY